MLTILGALTSRVGLYALGALAIVGAVLAALAGARNAGRAAERVDVMKNTLEIKHAQQKAAAAAPRDRAGVVGRLRNGDF